MDNRLYEDIIRQLPIAYAYHRMIFDTEGVPVDYEIIDVNDKFLGMFNKNRTEVIGETGSKLLPTINEKDFKWIKLYDSILKKAEFTEFEQYSSFLNCWQLIQVTPYNSDHFLTVYTEITEERVRVAQKHRKVTDVSYEYIPVFDRNGKFDEGAGMTKREEKLLKKIINQVPGGIYQFELLKDGEYTIPFYSKDFLSVFRLQESEINDDISAIFRKIHPDDYRKTMDSINHAVNNNKVWDTEFRIVVENGEERWIQGKSKPEVFENGKVIWYGHVSDVTEEKKQKIAIEDREKLMGTLFSQLPGVLFQFDVFPNATVEFNVISEGILDILEITSSEAKKDADTVYSRIHQEDINEVEANFRHCSKNLLTWSQDFRVELPSKRVRWLRANAKPQMLENQTVRFYGYVYDITSMKKNELKLSDRDKLISTIFDRVPGAIYQYHLDINGRGSFPMASKGIEDIFELTPKEAQEDAMKIFLMFHPDDKPSVLKDIKESARTLKEFSVDYRIITPSKKIKWLRANALPKCLDDGSILWNGYVSDISELKKNENALIESERSYKKLAAEMEMMANHDMLTTLPNRRLLFDRLSQAILQCKRIGSKVGLMFLDLNDFKAINDQFGHEIGDRVLVFVGENLRKSVRETDTVGRIGGDEFLIILSNLHHVDEVHQVAKKVVNAMETPFEYKGHLLKIGISIGIVTYPEDGHSLEELLNNADKAMYQMKNEVNMHCRDGSHKS